MGQRAPSALPERYTWIAILLHWLVAILVVLQFAWGWWMQSIAKTPQGPRADAFNWHKSVGLTILALMVLRLAWRLMHRPPPLPEMPAWRSRLARASHLSMYCALIILPLAGYLGSVFSGYPINYFGWSLPLWGARQLAVKDAMSAVHLVTSWILAAAVCLHLAGAFKHAFIDRDRLLTRMGIGSWS